MSNLTRNGVRLAYDEAGSGGPPLLFVHGFGGSARHFDAQVEHFARAHRVVAIDRRGHGRSDAPEGPYGIPEIAEEVAWLTKELGLHKPVLAVHSMGAIGLEAVAKNPDLFSALVVIDAPWSPPAQVKEIFEQVAGGLTTPAYKQVIDQVCEQMIFLPTDDKERRARLHAALFETPQHVLAATWRGFIAYDPKAAAAKCKLPLLWIAGVMPADLADLRATCPQVMIGQTVGSGHMTPAEVPDQINAMIGRFLAVAGIDRGRQA